MEEYNERVGIKEEDSSILQSLQTATSAHTFSCNPTTYFNLPRWDLGLVPTIPNQKLLTAKQFFIPLICPSSSLIGQSSPRGCPQLQSSSCSSSCWGYATRRTGKVTDVHRGQNCTISSTHSTAPRSRQNPPGRGSPNTHRQSPDLACRRMYFQWLPTKQPPQPQQARLLCQQTCSTSTEHCPTEDQHQRLQAFQAPTVDQQDKSCYGADKAGSSGPGWHPSDPAKRQNLPPGTRHRKARPTVLHCPTPSIGHQHQAK